MEKKIIEKKNYEMKKNKGFLQPFFFFISNRLII